jgi:hypothetical protein
MLDEILRMLVSGKKVSLALYVIAGVFLGVQYADFRYKLNRIEDRLSAVENRIAALETQPKRVAVIP